jgi:hypothetical protein
MSSDLWITDDGSYGTGKALIVKTAKWTEEDWQEFEQASDSNRLSVALQIGDRYYDNENL